MPTKSEFRGRCPVHRVNIILSEISGIPCVSVPQEAIWSLVEYLAFRRVQADFSYEAKGFLAIFSHLSMASAQQILDDWASYEVEMAEVPIDAAASYAEEPVTA